ncbi:MAG TPA: hypothetical protein VEL31_29705 [Ktedonobacteraceae bacterium]|nr:hypothetical protein [Ktedonobacteraceae bacterium]
MSDKLQSSSQQQQSSSATPEPQIPTTATPPEQHGGKQEQALPISPLTGEPYDPEWGAVIQKGGDSNQRTIQQITKPEIERKDA